MKLISLCTLYIPYNTFLFQMFVIKFAVSSMLHTNENKKIIADCARGGAGEAGPHPLVREEHNSAAENVWKWNSFFLYSNCLCCYYKCSNLWVYLLTNRASGNLLPFILHWRHIRLGHSQPRRSGWGKHTYGTLRFLALLAPQRQCSSRALLVRLIPRLGASVRIFGFSLYFPVGSHSAGRMSQIVLYIFT